MKARHIVYFLFALLLIFYVKSSWAQHISAEYITSFKPPKLLSGEQIEDGIQNLYFYQNRLYVVDIWSGLQILDVSNIYKPKELGVFFTEHRPHNVVIDSAYAYLSDEIGGVAILNINNPASVRQVAKVKTKGDAYWVVARYPYLFVAEETKGLGVYDISDLQNIRRVAGFATRGWAWTMSLEGDHLFLSEKSGGVSILDVSDPTQPKLLSTFHQAHYAKSIQVDGNIAVIADGPDGLLIVDARDAGHPKLLKRIPIDGYAYHAFKSGNTVFISNDQRHRMEIYDISDPLHPSKEGEYKAENKVYSSLKYDVYLFVAADKQTLILRYNRPPQIARIENQVVDENQLLEIQAEPSDPDEDPFTLSIKNLPQGAKFDSTSRLFTWVPTYEQSGDYKKVTITVTEKTVSALSASTSFDIHVNHVNRPPSIASVADTVINENQLLTFTGPEGSDPDKEDQGKLTYSVENLPEGATFNPETRIFSWKPTFEQSGVYPVTFTVRDPVGATARVQSVITVNHVDRPPVLAKIGDKEVAENTLLTFKVEGSDPDKEDQNALSYKAENLPQGASFDPATATFSWTPTYDQSGIYKDVLFIFKAGALSDSEAITITVDHVNRPPRLNPITDQVVDENKWLRFTVSGTDPDKEDAGKWVFSAENLPEGAKFNPDSALFSWKPTYEQSGVYKNIIFKIKDPAGLSDSSVITITVNHVNRPPLLAAIEPKTIDENSLLTFILQGSDPDKEDQGKLTYTVTGLPEGATLTGAEFKWTPTYDQSGIYKLQFTVSDGQYQDTKETTITVNHVNRPPVLNAIAAQTVDENKLLTFAVTGSDPDKEDQGKLTFSASGLPQGAVFDSTGHTFNWTPTYEQSGKYTVTFTMKDPAGLTDEKQVRITVNHVNRTPILPEQPAQTVDENTPLVYKIVPGSDPDKEDQDKLQYTVSDLPQGATFDATHLVLNWTPTYEQSGQYTVTIHLTDGQITVSQPLQITVNHVNRPPVLTDIADQTIDEHALWTLKVQFTDADKEDAGKLKLSAANLPQGATFDAQTATFNWTPTYEQSGQYKGIQVTVTDPAGLSDSKTFNITVNNIDRPPVLQAVAAVTGKENEPVTFRLQATDPDKEDQGKLIYSADHLPEGATLDAGSGEFSWTPTFTQAGKYSLTFKVSDTGNLSAEQSATLVIEDVNHPPLLNDIPAQNTDEDKALSFKITGTDEDTDNQLTYSAQNLPRGAAFDAASQTFSWKPDFDQAGKYTVTFKVSDGKAEAQKTVDITVNNVNRPPRIDGPATASAEAGQSIKLKYHASDPDKDKVTYSVSGLPDGAHFNSADGTFTWTPGDAQSGNYTIEVSASDGTTSAKIKTGITITAKPAPRPAPVDSTQH